MSKSFSGDVKEKRFVAIQYALVFLLSFFFLLSLSQSLIIQRSGRKPLLLGGFSIMFIMLLLITIMLNLQVRLQFTSPPQLRHRMRP